MSQPRGTLKYSVSFGPNGKESKVRTPGRVGHLLFVAPYSGALNPERKSADLTLHALEADPHFQIVAGVLPIEPLRPGGDIALYPYAHAESLQPSALLRNLAPLTELWKPLAELHHSPKAAEELARVLSASSPAPATAASSAAARPPATAEKQEDLLERLLGQRPPGSKPELSAAAQLVQRLAEQAVTSHHPEVVSQAKAQDTDVATRARAELSRRLRELLRQSAFQDLSASIFATEMVVRSCPDPSLASFSAVDASWSELLAQPLDFDALLERACPSVLVVDHHFTPDPTELQGLVELIRLCHKRGVFLVTGAESSLAGLEANPALDTWQDDWTDSARESWAQLGALREQGAQFALTLPRCLVRQPYGRRGEPLEDLDFEELEDRPPSAHLLWANGAYLVARALMEQWCLGRTEPDLLYDIGGLPVVTVPDGDGRRLVAAIERELPHSAVEQLLDQGFSVIETSRDPDRARIHL